MLPGSVVNEKYPKRLGLPTQVDGEEEISSGCQSLGVGDWSPSLYREVNQYENLQIPSVLLLMVSHGGQVGVKAHALC